VLQRYGYQPAGRRP